LLLDTSSTNPSPILSRITYPFPFFSVHCRKASQFQSQSPSHHHIQTIKRTLGRGCEAPLAEPSAERIETVGREAIVSKLSLCRGVVVVGVVG
jgi:hypothetical protein